MMNIAPAVVVPRRGAGVGGRAERQRRLGLRSHLVGLVLAVLLPALALGGATAWHMAQNYRRAAEGRLLDTARVLALATDAEIGVVLAAAETLAASPLLDDPAGLAAFRTQAQRVAEALDTFVVVSGLDPPRQILNTRFPPGAALPPIVAPELVAEVIRTHRSAVSDLRVPPALGEPVTAVLAPVLRDGRAEKVVAVPFRPARLLQLLQAQALSGEAFSAIMDGAHTIVARSRRHEELVGTPAPAWAEGVIAGRERGLMTGLSLEGADVVAAFQRLASAPGWFVIVAEPLAAHKATWQRPLLGLATGGAAAFALALLLAGWLARRVLDPVGALVRRAEAVTAGGGARAHPPEVLPAPVAEFEALRVAGARAEAALAEGEAQLRRVLDNLFAFVGLLTPEGILLEANRAPLEAAGITLEEVRGRPFWECYWWSHDPAVQSRVRQACARAAAGESVRYDVAVRMVGDRRMMIDFQIAPLRDAAGRITHLVPSATDIDARVAATAALADSEARLRLATQAGQVGVFDWNLETGELHWDVRLREIFALPEGAPASTEAFFAGIHPEDRARVEATVAQALDLAGDGAYAAEFRVIGATDGVERHLEARARVTFAEGRAVRMTGTAADVTAQRRAAEVLARDRAELERLVEERTAELLTAADERRRAEETSRQAEKLAALGQLTGGVAHDFNNLLQVVSSGAALLKRAGLPEDRRAAILEGMINAGQSARDLTGRLLAFARRQALRPEVLDLNERLGGMAELLRRTLGAGIRLDTDFAPDLWPVRADPGQLEIAVLNLALNARDAMPQGGTLVLRTRNATLPEAGERAAGDYVCLVVQDTGEGMPPAVLARVFEPFFTTKEDGRGTGLGLPQVFGFAKQSGGDIEIRSQLRLGTAVTLHLPRAEAAQPPEQPPASDAVLDALRSSSGRRVLVVEDNAAAAGFAASLLEEMGYASLRVGSAAEALDVLARGDRVDAVFSDIVMPGGMDGIALAAALRRTHHDIPVVLTSGYSARAATVGLPDGIELLNKPYRQDELAAALQRAFSAPRGTGATPRG